MKANRNRVLQKKKFWLFTVCFLFIIFSCYGCVNSSNKESQELTIEANYDSINNENLSVHGILYVYSEDDINFLRKGIYETADYNGCIENSTYTVSMDVVSRITDKNSEIVIDNFTTTVKTARNIGSITYFIKIPNLKVE